MRYEYKYGLDGPLLGLMSYVPLTALRLCNFACHIKRCRNHMPLSAEIIGRFPMSK